MSSTAGNDLTVDLSALRKLKHTLDNITLQKWGGGARHIGEPLDHKCGGLEPLGPIGVYAYGCIGYTCLGERFIQTVQTRVE